MKQSQSLKTTQKLALTMQLQQSLRILSLSTTELQAEIDAQLEENPFLEVVDEYNEQAASSIDTAKSGDTIDHTNPAEPNESGDQDELRDLSQTMENMQLSNELSMDVNWEDLYDYSYSNAETEDTDFNQLYSGQIELGSKLTEQLNLLHLSHLDRIIAVTIIDAIDPQGYLESSVAEIVQSVQLNLLSCDEQVLAQLDLCIEDCAAPEVEAVRKQIMHLEPMGCGCLNLVEFLLLQLSKASLTPNVGHNAKKLLEHPDLLAKKDKPALLKATKLSEADFREALLALQQLHSSPVRLDDQPMQSQTIPDLIVSSKNNTYTLELNPDVLPKLRASKTNFHRINAANDAQSQTFIKENQHNAKTFIRAVQDRNATLLKVANAILRSQPAYLQHGASALRPMILKDIAEQLGMHESTISRATSNKFMLCKHGLIELKSFFSSSLSTHAGDDASSTAICMRIKKLISQEGPKPLSDQKIAEQLNSEGVDIARRTVAKYREMMGIYPTSERKKLL